VDKPVQVQSFGPGALEGSLNGRVGGNKFSAQAREMREEDSFDCEGRSLSTYDRSCFFVDPYCVLWSEVSITHGLGRVMKFLGRRSSN
jgi:hypothetical protein